MPDGARERIGARDFEKIIERDERKMRRKVTAGF